MGEAKVTSGTTNLPVNFAVIALTGTGTLVAAVAGLKIRVISAAFTVAGDAAGSAGVIFKSAAGGTALTGAFGLPGANGVTNTPIVLPLNEAGWFETAAGALLEGAVTGTTPKVGGCLSYVLVP